RHLLHFLAIAKLQALNEASASLDVGSGGGFPAIPLAILFPHANFTLVDAIGKKIRVVDEVVEGLGLENVSTVHGRVEELTGSYDFIVSRAVAAMPTFVHWTRGKIKKDSAHERKNGILYLKGGDLEEELKEYASVQVFDLQEHFQEEFFETKKVVYLPQKYKGRP